MVNNILLNCGMKNMEKNTVLTITQRVYPIIIEKLRMDLESYLELTELKYKPSGYSRLIQSIHNRNQDGISVVRINQIIAETAERAGVKSPNPNRKHVHPHLFRHNFVRFSRRYKLNFKVISQIIGHQSVATTMDLYGTPANECSRKTRQKKAPQTG